MHKNIRQFDYKSKKRNAMRSITTILSVTLLFTLISVPFTNGDVSAATNFRQADKVVSIAMSKRGKTSGYFGFGGAWCSKFVYWTLKKSGLANNHNFPKKNPGSSQDYADYYVKKKSYVALSRKDAGYRGKGTKVNRKYVPKKGDMVFFRSSGGGDIHHVGFVRSVKMKNGKPHRVKVIHGNWGGKVRLTEFKAYGSKWGEKICAYATPNYSYEVGFDAGCGTVVKEKITVTKGAKYGQLPEAVREGYQFRGWYTKPEGGEQVTAKTNVSKRESHTLYAQWICLEDSTLPATSPKEPGPDSFGDDDDTGNVDDSIGDN